MEVPEWGAPTHSTVQTGSREEEENKRWILSVDEEREFIARFFVIYGHPLEMVISFRYLVRVILAVDNNWTEVVSNLSRMRAVWKRMM